MAIHGYQHIYSSNCKGDYLGLGGNTEFAGYSYEEQFRKLTLGLDIFKERKNFDEALKMYQKSSEVNPNFLEANYNISQIYLKLRKLDLGLQYLKKILEKFLKKQNLIKMDLFNMLLRLKLET